VQIAKLLTGNPPLGVECPEDDLHECIEAEGLLHMNPRIFKLGVQMNFGVIVRSAVGARNQTALENEDRDGIPQLLSMVIQYIAPAQRTPQAHPSEVQPDQVGMARTEANDRRFGCQ
jgi:hypothetical protein